MSVNKFETIYPVPGGVHYHPESNTYRENNMDISYPYQLQWEVWQKAQAALTGLLPEDLQELKKLAQHASPGLWHSAHHGVFCDHPQTKDIQLLVCNVSGTTGKYETEAQNRHYIAKACPENILKWLADYERLRAAAL